jgi:adenine-specific DNA-methyltransferase
MAIDSPLGAPIAFLAIGLAGQRLRSRTALATITRAVNRLFMMPTPIFFRYGDKLTLAIILRRPGKRDTQRDVLAKVTLIKDIDLRQPHAAHIRILEELALANLRQGQQVGSFDELQSAWAKTLDISELNKRFYQELANWYHWAVTTVHFPPGDGQEEAETRHAVAVIRLITRLIFVWFIKEKGLVPDALFDRADRWTAADVGPDPQQSSYYKAILQNLFFATLNTEMERDKPGNRHAFAAAERGGTQSPITACPRAIAIRRTLHRPRAALRRFADIPFLNGGLFECLDRPEQGMRIDGFSDRPDNPLRVPDELFFGARHAIDSQRGLRHAQQAVQGARPARDLPPVTSSPSRRTRPSTKEVALDPELLGKVFENLLPPTTRRRAPLRASRPAPSTPRARSSITWSMRRCCGSSFH